MDKTNVEQNDETLQEVKYIPSETENDHKLLPDNSIRKADSLYLYFAVLSAQLMVLVSGGAVVWLSPVLVKLSSNDTEINSLSRPITTVEVSILAGSPTLASLIGTLLLPKISDILGRKGFLQVSGILVMLSGTGVALSENITYMIIFRCIFMTFLQAAMAVMPIYVAEICEDRNRTKFGCFWGVSHQVGHFLAYLIGPILTIRDFTLVITLPSLIFSIIAFFFPESPFYLFSRGKESECKRALRKFRNNITEADLQLELSKIKKSFESQNDAKKANVLSLFKNRENRIALLLALLPLLVQHLSGVAVIMQFLAPLFNSAGTSLSGDKVAVLVSTVKISCFTFTTFIVQKFGRRKLLIVSATGTAFPLFALGVYFYLQCINSSYIVYLQWLPLTALIGNVVIYAMGLGPIPSPLVGELFSSDIRAVASGVVWTILSVVIFLLISSFPIVSQAFGMHCCLFMFSISCLVGAALIYAYLPETKGKSLIEIQEILKHY